MAGRMQPKLLLATRSSPLALAQAGQVAVLLERITRVRTRLVPIVSAAAHTETDDKSRFVRAVDDAVLSGRADLAVHSAKDVPGERPSGLALAAVPRRAEARDGLCGAASLAALPVGARVGTSSLRRRAQLLVVRPDVDVLELRGNVDSRLRRLRGGQFDALVLAAAGLERLGLHCDGLLSTEAMVPAPGQGALMLEARSGDAETLELVAALNDADSERALQAERTLAAALGASCHTPVGAHARTSATGLALHAFVGAADGSVSATVAVDGDVDGGRRLAKSLARVLRREHREAVEAAELTPDWAMTPSRARA